MVARRKTVEKAPESDAEAMQPQVEDAHKDLRLKTPAGYIELGEVLAGLGYKHSKDITSPLMKDDVKYQLETVIIELANLALIELIKMLLKDLSLGNGARVGTMVCNGLRIAGV